VRCCGHKVRRISETQVVLAEKLKRVPVGTEKTLYALAKEMKDEGNVITSIGYPAVNAKNQRGKTL